MRDGAQRPRGSSIAVVTHLFPSSDHEHRGPWVVEQVDALHRLTDISVLCCSQTATDRIELRPSGVRVTFRSTRTIFGHGRTGLLASSVRYDRALARHLRSEPTIGLVHAHFGIPDAIIVRRQTRRHGLPYVVTLHGDDAFTVMPRRDVIGSAVRRAVLDADAVICVSSAMAQAVRSVLPAVEPVVIQNGYDDDLFRLSTRDRDLGLLFVGNLVPVKNLDALLRAYHRVRARISSPLTLVGDGFLRPGLESLARELGIDDSVRFLGVRSRREVADLMSRASALLLPSLREGWGVVVSEALACGTPVVAARVGGVPEIMSSGDGGILIPPGDSDALERAIIEIVRWQPDRARVAAASKARPWSGQARLIADVYQRVLAGDASGRST